LALECASLQAYQLYERIRILQSEACWMINQMNRDDNLLVHDTTNLKRRIPFNQRLNFWIVVLFIVLIWGDYRFWLGMLSRRTSVAPPVVVVLSKVSSATVPVYLTAIGSVIPTNTVTVKTQINGTLTQVAFREGQMIKAGDLLAQIDPRPYQAQLLEYEGQLLRDQALLENALIDLKRYQTLYKQNAVSQQTLATQESLVKQYRGAVQIDQGLIESTKVSLIYCKITAPVDGRVGLRLVDPGNFVQTSDSNGIAVVNTLNPITVIFTIAEDYIPDVLQKIYGNVPLAVEVYDRQQNKLLARGKLLTIDNQVDPTTGTVKLRAQFTNDNNLLFPSQFVNVKLLIKNLVNAVIIPTAAIQYSEKGHFAYVLNESKTNKTVSAKPINTLPVTINDKTVVASGVAPGQFVVTEGADNLMDGSPVSISLGHKII